MSSPDVSQAEQKDRNRKFYRNPNIFPHRNTHLLFVHYMWKQVGIILIPALYFCP